MNAAPILRVDDLNAHYGDFQALWNISLEVIKGEVVSIIGANSAGKSTLFSTLSGLLRPTQGTIEFEGSRIDRMQPHDIVSRGLVMVPEGRRMFSRMTVYENLMMGAYSPTARKRRFEVLENVYALFPILRERAKQLSSTLSGGQQQMLSIARAMMSEPKLLLCDEISLGLAPVMVKDIYKRLKEISELGTTIVLVEQDIKRSLKVADRAYVMLEGKIVLEGRPSEFSEDQIKKAYFGV